MQTTNLYTVPVLIVDDNAEFRQFIAAILSLGGFGCFFHARNGLEGVELAMRERPAVMVMDMMMPEMSGLRALRVLKTMPETMDIPIVILTAMVDLECLRGDYRAARVLSKPVNPKELIEVCRQLAVNSKARQFGESFDYGYFYPDAEAMAS
jgi:CheY-like chemotaxis protein